MMTSIQNRIDEWIARVKQRGAAAAFAFIPGYPAHKTPNPVTKYTVAVTAQEEKSAVFFIGNRIGHSVEGRLYEVGLCLRVYAPEGSSGASLLRECALLSDAFEAEDRNREIVSLSTSGIGFDTASRTEYRDINAKLSMVCKEAAE